MLKKTSSSPAGTTAGDVYDLSRRSLLRLGLMGGTMLLGPSFARAAGGPAETPVPGGTLTIGADADPIGLDPTTVTAFSSYDFTG